MRSTQGRRRSCEKLKDKLVTNVAHHRPSQVLLSLLQGIVSVASSHLCLELGQQLVGLHQAQSKVDPAAEEVQKDLMARAAEASMSGALALKTARATLSVLPNPYPASDLLMIDPAANVGQLTPDVCRTSFPRNHPMGS